MMFMKDDKMLYYAINSEYFLTKLSRSIANKEVY